MDEEQSIEERLEKTFGGGEENQPEPEEKPVESAAEDSEETVDEPESQDQPEDDSEEVEYEGATYKLPKPLKDALLRQSDYTRKTQDVAKQRKVYEELQQALTQEKQFHGAAFSKAVEASALESQIKRYEGLDWAQLAESDPAEYLKLDRALRALKDQHATARQEAQHAFSTAQQEAAKRQQVQAAKAHEELSRDIKGWGGELQAKLAESGRGYGFSADELNSILDPRMVKVLHDAHQWKTLQSGKSELTKKVQAAKPVTAPSARTAQTSQRTAQYTDARQKLRKSGSTADAERALEMRFASKVK